MRLKPAARLLPASNAASAGDGTLRWPANHENAIDQDLRPLLHLLLHALVPLAIARIFFRKRWKTAWLWLLAGWLIDIDHLWAEPIYAADRCSIGFHPLHRAPAIAVYALLLLPRRTRMLALGLLTHIGLDGVDCFWMRSG